ncbi:MAG TPA: hypothetical protein DCE41_14830 [Cytophagales bacterium]|nr:hypothetical protein [Cytophagales bacterium]HAA22579.1 hypothetical protein [Cytophagales bacterium]HAP61045.1 hypothetical protein [Cytophagales bacterium]
MAWLTMAWSPYHAKVTKTKTFSRTYNRAAIELLMVENQLGNVTVETHTLPEVKVEVEMRATKRDEQAALRVLEQMSIEETLSDKLLTLITDIGGQLNNQPGESIAINYRIWLPANLPVDITNSLGKLEVGDLTADDVRLSIDHGSFTLGKLTGQNLVLEASYVNGGKIGQIAHGSLELNYCQHMNIAQLGQVTLQLESSPMTIEKAQEILLDHEYQNVTINQIHILRGDLSFGRLMVGSLTGELELTGNHGLQVEVKEVAATAKAIDLDLDYTPCTLVFSNQARGQLEATTQGGAFSWKGDQLVMKQIGTEGMQKMYSGTLGGGGPLTVVLETTQGSLSLQTK